MTKKILLVCLVISLSFKATAQEWQSDLQEAKKIATVENQKIILVFQGSDWCAPCIKLDNEIWSSDEFKAYSKGHYVMLLADFPRKKKNKLSKSQQEKNNKLAEEYNKQGFFPFVAVLDKNGVLLGSTGYKKVSVTDYIEILNSI
ncbi:thioredoxin family protein [Aureibaculum sp. A20]|uniref:Thioredoxin family protein n=1 Tax=Aureibaculum flavum TaxID=2795986 RepID=A0ABS0WW06_9FLAO|nr:thioredoxin family protein [Aureibaculum flavum]MBJ2176028.1 thioredoxin family protein [Aureibaculum flavum]